MFLFQLLASLFILLVIARVVSRYKEHRLPKSEMLIWLIFWLLIGGAVWWPHGTDLLAAKLGISRGYELVVAMSLALLFYLVFQLYSHVHHLEHEITRLVRSLALEKEDTSDKEEL